MGIVTGLVGSVVIIALVIRGGIGFYNDYINRGKKVEPN